MMSFRHISILSNQCCVRYLFPFFFSSSKLPKNVFLYNFRDYIYRRDQGDSSFQSILGENKCDYSVPTGEAMTPLSIFLPGNPVDGEPVELREDAWKVGRGWRLPVEENGNPLCALPGEPGNGKRSGGCPLWSRRVEHDWPSSNNSILPLLLK